MYIEDELSLGRIVHATLEKQGYDVTWESNGANVMGHFDEKMPDVCVLDIMLPGIDGYSLCRTIRGIYPFLPVIFLTARTSTGDLVKGFEAGGTDYIKKPFSIEELIARIENQVRLARGVRNEGEIPVNISLGKYSVDFVRYELTTPSGSKKLSNREMQVLRMLYANRNSIISRKDLLMTVWGDDSYFNSRNLDVYMRKLRNYFDDETVRIVTLKGNGYLFIVRD